MPFQDTMQGADFPYQGHGKVRSILLTSPVPESQRVQRALWVRSSW